MKLLKRLRGKPETGDLALAQRILAGDEHAFDSFFEGHFPGLYRFVLARVRDPDLAADVAQTAICRAITHLSSYRGEASLAGWLYTICRHEISTLGRKSKRRPTVELCEDEPEIQAALESLATSPTDPGEAFEDKELARLVHTALDRLPSHYGQVLEWKYLEGVSVAEIGGRLKLGPKAAESMLTRARAAFREAFASFGSGFESFIGGST